MKKVESQTTTNYATEVTGAGLVIDYRATIGAEEPVSSIFGTVKKNDTPIGYVVYNKGRDSLCISFEPFSATTAKERKTVVTAAVVDIEEILTAQ